MNEHDPLATDTCAYDLDVGPVAYAISRAQVHWTTHRELAKEELNEALQHLIEIIVSIRMTSSPRSVRGGRKLEIRRLLAELASTVAVEAGSELTSDSPTKPWAAPRASVGSVSPETIEETDLKREGCDVVLRNGRVGTVIKRFVRNIDGKNEVALVLDLGKSRQTVLARDVDVL